MPTSSKECCKESCKEATQKRETKVVIQYCEVGNYSKVARDQDRSIRAEFAGFPVEVERVSSSGGIYEVSVNGKLIFSKKATYRLPDDDEVFYHVRASLLFPPVRPPALVGLTPPALVGLTPRGHRRFTLAPR